MCVHYLVKMDELIQWHFWDTELQASGIGRKNAYGTYSADEFKI